MKTIEHAAKNHDKYLRDLGFSEEIVNVANGSFIDGWNTALEKQWHSVKIRMPDKTLVRKGKILGMRGIGRGIEAGIAMFDQNETLCFETEYENINATYWMQIPSFKKEDKK